MVEFHKKILKNGLTVLFEKRDVPVTTVMLATKFGAIDENEQNKGIAHLIEHLCFKGTAKRNAKEIAETVERVGGILNAFTSEEQTAYHVKLPSEHLNLAMEIIFDIFFNPAFPEEEIEKEKNVICEEIKMYHDNPRYHVLTEIKSCLYDSPFGMSIAGTEEIVKSLPREEIVNTHKKYYCPENAILGVVGNNNFDEVVKMAENLSVSRKFEGKAKPKINFKAENKTEIRKEIQQANLAIGFHFPTMSEKERYASEVFSAILGEGMSSKLFTEVREKRGLVYTVRSELDSGKDYSYLIIYAGTDKDKVEEVIKICSEEFKKLKEISSNEIEQAKQQVIGNSKVESEDCANSALNLILEEVAGKAEDYYEYDNNIKKVSLEDIKNLADKTKFSYFVLSP